MKLPPVLSETRVTRFMFTLPKPRLIRVTSLALATWIMLASSEADSVSRKSAKVTRARRMPFSPLR